MVFAGGALSTGRLFGYNANTRQVLIPNELWIELSRLGYWVSQAVILQWAEKTANLGEGRRPRLQWRLVLESCLEPQS